MADWYYTRNGQRIGPVTKDVLAELAVAGDLAPSDPVWTDGLADWVRADRVKGLTFKAEPQQQSEPERSTPPATIIVGESSSVPVADRKRSIGTLLRVGVPVVAALVVLVLWRLSCESEDGTVPTQGVGSSPISSAASLTKDQELNNQGHEAFKRKDYPTAISCFERAAAQGSSNARENLLIAWYNFALSHSEANTPEGDVEAVKWYTKAAEAGYPNAEVNLGWHYEFGRGVNQSYAEAAKWYKAAADQGEAIALSNLGSLTRDGKGVTKDETEAVRLFRLSANKGCVDAMRKLGWMLADGRGIEKNEEEAVKLFRQAADKGETAAYNALGQMYEGGRGVPKDDAEAVNWYLKTAEKGNVFGQFRLGWIHAREDSPVRNDQESVKWYRKAADQGDDAAQLNLGWMYNYGRGVPQSHQEAFNWYLRSARQGNATAQMNLALYLSDGAVFTKDLVSAYAWANVAAGKGAASAIETRDRLAPLLTPAQLVEGQRRGAELEKSLKGK